MPTGVMMCMWRSIDVFGLTAEQVKAFFDKHRADGKPLDGSTDVWDVFKARMRAADRDLGEDDDGYDFTNYVTEVLADTDHPIQAQA
ncbi:hypothetical protein HOI83_04315 [Candidatus Uhrbacteria bacterium]|nr:hypothetical protein [Candidatus Uhrbacteria bacterium]